MKTHILHLETYDDLHSIQDKIDWGHSESVLLVLPIRRPPLQRKLDLLLLQRHAQATGARIALVTRNRRVKEFAALLEIPVFRSLRQAQQIPWQVVDLHVERNLPQRPKRKNMKKLQRTTSRDKNSETPMHPVVRWTAFIFGLSAFLAVLAALFPSAEIKLTPQTQSQEIKIGLSANPALVSTNPVGVLPAEIISKVVEGRAELDASGTQAIPQQAASGEVVFTNLTDLAIDIPAGTIVRTLDDTPVRFATSEDAELPAEAGSSIEVAVGALNPGTGGNLPAESLVTVEGELALSVTVINPEQTSGGTEQNSATPTLTDYDSLRESLLDDLWQTALAETESSQNPGDFIVYSNPIGVSILEEEYTPPEPQPSDKLELLLRVEYQIMVVPWEALKTVGNFNLDAALPYGFSTYPEEIIILAMDIPEIDENKIARWEVLAQRPIFQKIGTGYAARLTAGRTISSAAETLQSELRLAEPPEIQLFPHWWPWMPFLPLRIQIISGG
jgi:hypothetical protein